jgi:hypothetical protein
MEIKTVYGLKILYKLNILFQIFFLPDFNKEQIISMIDDLYSNFHTSNDYSFQFLLENGEFYEVDKKSFQKFLNDDEENIFEIGFL